MPVKALLPIAKQAWPYIAPYAKEIALRTGVGVGGYLGGKLLGGAETERYQKQLQEQMRLIQEQIRSPGTTPIGQAIQKTIKQQGKQAQQALAASAAQRGQTGTSPARASQMQQLGRESAQEAQAMAQLSTAAQADYTNLLGAQERLAADERSKIAGITNFIARGVASVATRKLLMDVMQGMWQSPESTMGTLPATTLEQGIGLPKGMWQSPESTMGTLPATTPEQEIGLPTQPMERGVTQTPSPAIETAPAPTIDAVTGTSQPQNIATALPRGISTPAPTRPEERYPTPLIQRQPAPAMPAYTPPVTEQMPTAETLRAPAATLPQTPPEVTQPPTVYPIPEYKFEPFVFEKGYVTAEEDQRRTAATPTVSMEIIQDTFPGMPLADVNVIKRYFDLLAESDNPEYIIRGNTWQISTWINEAMARILMQHPGWSQVPVYQKAIAELRRLGYGKAGD